MNKRYFFTKEKLKKINRITFYKNARKGKDRRIKNWRSISLVNVDVKIDFKAIAMRLEKVLPSIIHYKQSAFVKGRNLFYAVRINET